MRYSTLCRYRGVQYVKREYEQEKDAGEAREEQFFSFLFISFEEDGGLGDGYGYHICRVRPRK